MMDITYDVVGVFFVPLDAKVELSSIRIHSDKFRKKIKIGDKWSTNHKKLDVDPFDKTRKDLVIRAKDSQGNLYQWRFTESADTKREINISILESNRITL